MAHLPPHPEEVLADIAPLVPIAYQAMEVGTQIATHFFRSLAGQDHRKGIRVTKGNDPDLFPCLVRFFAKREFDRHQVHASFDREALRNNGLLLHYQGQSRAYNIRVLKNDAGQLPLPGKSMRKIKFYQQAFDFIGSSPTSGLNLVVLWYLNQRTWLDHLSLVCPKNGSETSAEAYWQHPIPHPANANTAAPVVEQPDEIQITPKRIKKLGSGEKG